MFMRFFEIGRVVQPLGAPLGAPLQRHGAAGLADARGAFFRLCLFPFRRYASAFIGCSARHFSTISIVGGTGVHVRELKPAELGCSASQAGEMIGMLG